MKKLWIMFMGLLFCSTAHAGIISLGTISADATIDGFNNNFSTIKNAINGQIQGSATTGSSTNVLASSIGVLDMGPEANPQKRDSELLGIGIDTTTSSTSFIYTGLTPATSATLTSNISAGTAYINGYRVVKVATGETYLASSDTYVDLSATGVYTLSAVSNGSSAPSVAANSARLAKVVTSGTAITGVTDLSNRRIPGLIVPTNYRAGLIVSKDSATTVTIFPGSCEVNGTMIAPTSTTTLTLGTAGNWAGGSSLAAANIFGFVGVDASGNIKLHTTAPAYQNYALTLSAGRLRYASWSSTTYRILGWFYMNGNSQIDNASNIKEGDVSNVIMSTDESLITITASQTAYVNSNGTNFYNSGGPVLLMGTISGDSSAATAEWQLVHNRDGNDIAGSGQGSSVGGTNTDAQVVAPFVDLNQGSGGRAYKTRFRANGTDARIKNRKLIITEL